MLFCCSLIIIIFKKNVYRENGIKYRKDESVGGWFSQIGEMHQVHHLWGMSKCIYNANLILCMTLYIHMYMYNRSVCLSLSRVRF